MLLVFPCPTVRIDHRGLPVFLTLFTHGSPPDTYESECSFSTIIKTFCALLSAGRFSFFQCSVFPLLSFEVCFASVDLAFLFLEYICSGDHDSTVCVQGKQTPWNQREQPFRPGEGEREAQKRWPLPQGCGPTGVRVGTWAHREPSATQRWK